jgi:class 3 adenylate cyclase
VHSNDARFLNTISLFVPLPVSTGIKSGSFDYLAELREVTTMFMKWDSYNEEEHRDLLSLQACLSAAQEVIAESGGFMRQFLVDDKGCVLIACWGVPTASHPDNTRRAVCAGAIIGYRLDELGMKTSVGITTGNVFCGAVGSSVRREYAFVGSVVNLAARLMCNAKGGLFIDETTHSRVPSFLQKYFYKLLPLVVKGKAQPVIPYRLKKGMKKISLSDKDITRADDLLIAPACKNLLLEGS